MSLDYNKYLEKYTIQELKDIIIKPYRLHTVFTISHKTKGELIKDIMEHTELKKSGVYLKEKINKINNEPKKHTKLVNEEEKEIVKRIGSSRGMLDKLKEDKFKLLYDDPYYIDGREGNMPKKNVDKKKLKELEDDVIKYKLELKKALEDYRKFKLL